MRKLNKEKRPSGQVVKANKKAIVISTLLALMGVTVAVVFYQYTYSAKLEQELNNKQYQLEERIKEVETQKQQIINQDNEKTKLEQERQNLEQQKQELEKQLQAKAEAKQAEKARVASIQTVQATSAPKVVQSTTPTPQVSSGGCEGLRNKLSSLGVLGANLDAAITLAKRESSCNEYAVNKSSGACGAFQSLPCGKWGAPGTDQYYLGAINYANSRYGSYSGALSFSYANGWY